MSEQSTATEQIIARLGPVHVALRADLEFTRHVFRGVPAYVVRDPITFQSHQFSQSDYQVVIALRDDRSLQDCFQSLVDQGALEADQEEAFYHFVLTLHHRGFLRLPLADSATLYRRYAQRQRSKQLRRLTGILFLRVPIWNPDTFLDRTVRWFRPLFTRTAFCGWCLLVALALLLLLKQWHRFTHPMHGLLSNESLGFLWIALIGLKVFHEFGHAYACKVFGGRVPEMGAFFIAFTPCAYVDASTAWSFPRLGQRMVVSLAGMYFETTTACIALFVWSWTDNALVSSCAHHVVLLASIVTIGFNLNPLMRYDGYYVFSDLVGIPNLRQRAMEHLQQLAKRRILGLPLPVATVPWRERMILTGYGVATLLYRVTLIVAICAMIALKFYLLGLALAVAFLVTLVGGTILRFVHYTLRAEETRPVRRRAVLLALLLLVGLPAALAVIPIPGHVQVSGVIQTRDDRVIRASTGGFLRAVDAHIGDQVKAGNPLCRLQNRWLRNQVDLRRAEVRLRQLAYASDINTSPVSAATDRLFLQQSELQLNDTRARLSELQVRSPQAGRLIQVVDQRDLGKYFAQGDPIGICAAGPWVVRCLLDSRKIEDVAPRTGDRVTVRMPTADSVRDLQGIIERVSTSGSRYVADRALTQLGGGSIPVVPGTQIAERPFFVVLVRLPASASTDYQRGARVRLRFATQPQSYGHWFYQRLQRFLSTLRTR